MNSKIKYLKFLIACLGILGIATGLNWFRERTYEADLIVGVHVKGEVNVPGYYELSYGSRVKDAIDYAGGKTANADIDNINLAMKLIDGQELIIAAKETKESAKVPETETETKKINLNEADMYTLCQLDGIGEETAGAILEYRARKGAFKSIDELKKVKGIGQSKLDAIKDEITV